MQTNSQIAALPYVRLNDETLICLVSTRRTGRWVIPKGWEKPGIKPYDNAANEALEEAGLIGEICPEPAANFTYNKRLHTFASVSCDVKIYLLEVTSQLISWREQHQREFVWVSCEEAINLVEDDELAEILAQTDRLITG